jgi:hypothetical protein
MNTVKDNSKAVREYIFGPIGSITPDSWLHHLVTCMPKDEAKTTFDCFDGVLIFHVEDKIMEMPKIPVFALRKKVFEKMNPGHTFHVASEEFRKKYTVDYLNN